MDGGIALQKQRNTVFTIVAIAIILSLLVVGIIAEKEKKEWFSDFQLKKQAEYLITKDEFQQAKKILEELLAKERHARNPSVIQDYALCVNVLGDHEKALEYYDLARKANPLLVKDSLYLAKYAETLYKLGRNEEAKKYLEVSILINENTELEPLLIQLKDEINKNVRL